MSDDLTQRRHRRNPLELQLTAMIDVFSMIVIFLIMGTVFGVSDLVMPKDLMLPKSNSKESIDSAPRLLIDKGNISANFIKEVIPISVFRAQDSGDQQKLRNYREKLNTFVSGLPESAKKAGTLLSIVADEHTPYRDIFDVVRVFREAGFETLLFVAEGEEKPQ